MRIGIVTFQNAENYGAALQCKALYTYLSDNGNDVEVIDYKSVAIEEAYRLFPRFRKNLFLLSQQYINTIIHYRDLKGRKNRFHAFSESYNKTLPMTSNEILKTVFDYDLVIAGSDQIWNPVIAKGLDRIYFLEFNGCFRKAGYAVSMGNIHYPQFEEPRFYEYIKAFDYLSFREPDAADFVGSKLGRKFPQVVDPTLLLTRKQWDNIIRDISFPVPSKYILVYYLLEGQSSKDIIKITEYMAHEYNIPIINIKMGRKAANDFNVKVNNLLDLGPYEFVYLIKNASMVVTSSFHATALSCIYQKDLSVVIPEERGSRVRALADMFHLGDRVYSSYEDFIERCNEEKLPIDNRTVEYQEALKRSVNYLHEITGVDNHH